MKPPVTGSGLVSIANDLLSQLNLPDRLIYCTSDINSSFFVILFEGLCGEKLPDLIDPPITREDEIHNCQSVIDTLSLDILNTSLSHINGADIVSGDLLAIRNLLEVMQGLIEFIMDKIENSSFQPNSSDQIQNSGLKSSNGLVNASESEIDPDQLSSELIDEFLTGEFYPVKERSHKDVYSNSDHLNDEQDGLYKNGDSTAELIALGQNSESKLSPEMKDKNSASNIGAGIVNEITNQPNSSQNVSPDSSLSASISLPQAPKPSSQQDNLFHHLGVRDDNGRQSRTNTADSTNDTVHHTYTHHLYHHYNGPKVSESINPVDTKEKYSNLISSGVNRSNLSSMSDRSAKDTHENLQRLMKNTAELTRSALGHSSSARLSQHPQHASSTVKLTNRSNPLNNIGDSSDISESAPKTNLGSKKTKRQSNLTSNTVSSALRSAGQCPPLGSSRVRFDKSCPNKSPVSRLSPSDSANKINSDVFCNSDPEINYKSNESDTAYDSELDEYRRKLHGLKSKKSVHFDDVLTDEATGDLAKIRKFLRKEAKPTDREKEIIERLYQIELMDFEDKVNDMVKQNREKTAKNDELFKQKVFRNPRTTKYRASKKYNATSGILKPRSRSRTKKQVKLRKRSASASPNFGRNSHQLFPNKELLPELLDQFPYLYLSTQTLHDLFNKSSYQLEAISRANQQVQRKSRAEKNIEEAERKQEALMNIMKKELQFNQRMKSIKERQQEVQLVKSNLRDQRIQSARARRYYNDYQVRMRSKMLKKRTKEEQVFRKLFKDCLEIQRKRIREIRDYSRENRQIRADRQKHDLDSIENFYRDQFIMISEAVNKERKERSVRDGAQTRVLEQMKTQLRKKMENEIQLFQEQLYRDEDDVYFRELEAERLRRELRAARLQLDIAH